MTPALEALARRAVAAKAWRQLTPRRNHVMMSRMEWKLIPGFRDCYEVSDAGHVRTWLKRGTRRRMPEPTTMIGYPISGYPTVLLRDAGGARKNLRVHQAVLLAFVGPCPPGHECRHINGTKSDNRVANLAWGTPGENANDKRRHGTMCEGRKVGTAKLHPLDAVAIGRLLDRGFGLDFLASMFGCNKSTIRNVRDGNTWRQAEALVAALEGAP